MDTFGGNSVTEGDRTGIYTLTLLSIFDALVGDEYTKEEMKNIIENTEKIWKQTEEYISLGMMDDLKKMNQNRMVARLERTLNDKPQLEKLNKAKE